MTAKERTLWERAVLVLRHNSVTPTAPRAEQVVAKPREQAASRRRRA